MAGHFHRLKIKDVIRETASTVSVSFEVPDDLLGHFKFIAGQYLTLRTIVDGHDLRRSYSICSAPHDNDLRVAIKETKDGFFSKFANVSFKAGMELEVMEPMGGFTAPADTGLHVFVAAGSGITPVVSIIKSHLETNEDIKILLIYGNRDWNDVIFKDQLQSLVKQYEGRFRLVHFLSGGAEEGTKSGRINIDSLMPLVGDDEELKTVRYFYLCGPDELIFHLKDTLVSKGVSTEQIKFELFSTPEDAKAKKVTSPVPHTAEEQINTYIIDGERFEVKVKSQESTILDIGLDAGIDLPFACQGGVCCTCRAKIEEGEVDMRQNFSLSDSEVKDGFVLTCQSYPKGVSVIVNYDE